MFIQRYILFFGASIFLIFVNSILDLGVNLFEVFILVYLFVSLEYIFDKLEDIEKNGTG